MTGADHAHDGAVLQPDLFASFGKPTLRLTTGVWGNVELATPDAGTGSASDGRGSAS